MGTFLISQIGESRLLSQQLDNAQSKVRQQDKYCSSYGMKMDKYQIIKCNLTVSLKCTSSQMKSTRCSLHIDQKTGGFDTTLVTVP